MKPQRLAQWVPSRAGVALIAVSLVGYLPATYPDPAALIPSFLGSLAIHVALARMRGWWLGPARHLLGGVGLAALLGGLMARSQLFVGDPRIALSAVPFLGFAVLVERGLASLLGGAPWSRPVGLAVGALGLGGTAGLVHWYLAIDFHSVLPVACPAATSILGLLLLLCWGWETLGPGRAGRHEEEPGGTPAASSGQDRPPPRRAS